MQCKKNLNTILAKNACKELNQLPENCRICPPMEWYHYLLGVGVGILTGFVNTLAGSGTLLITPFFIFMGLPADVANGTNRLGIFAQTMVGSFMLQRQNPVNLKGSEVLIVPSVIGAIGGSLLATQVPVKFLEGVIAVVMLLMIYPIARNSEKWMRVENASEEFHQKPLLVVIFFALGFYGGFIQAGTGIFILSAIVLIAERSLQYANLLKNLIVFLFTIPALAIYIYFGQVNWQIGLVVMVAQMSGAWFAARFLSKSSKANLVVRYMLIGILAVSGVIMLVRLVWG
jgi:uncharacterized membrane protein YfcA